MPTTKSTSRRRTPNRRRAASRSATNTKRSQHKAADILYEKDTICAIVDSGNKNFYIVRLLDKVKQGANEIKAAVLLSKGERNGVVTYQQRYKVTLREKDIVKEVNAEQIKGTPKKRLYEIEAKELERVNRLVNKLLESYTHETDEYEHSEERSNQDPDEDHDDVQDDQGEEAEEEDNNTAPSRPQRRVTGRKNQDGKIDVENGKADGRRRHGRTHEDVDDNGSLDGQDDENEVSRASKKKRSTNKKEESTKKESIDDRHTVKKKNEKPKKFKRGVFNPLVEVVETCNMLESQSDEIIDYQAVHSNNKNLIRAVNIGNYNLLHDLLYEDFFLSNMFERWAPENNVNAIELAFQKNDKKAVKMLLDEADNVNSYEGYNYGYGINYGYSSGIYDDDNEYDDHGHNKEDKDQRHKLKLAHEPPVGLHEIETGYVNEYTFGVKVRRVRPARGGREGNNAFTADMQQPRSVRGSLEKIFQYDFDPELFDLLRVHCGDHECIRRLPDVLMSGNIELAAYIASIPEQQGGYNIGFLHIEALTKTRASDLSENIKPVSITKKATGFEDITPLHCAAINPNKEILERLLKINPEYGCADSKGRKPIHYAACSRSPGALELLIATGVDINEADTAKITPLMYAAFNGRVDNVRLLLQDPRIVVEARQADRTTALHLAAMYGHAEVVKVFHEREANLDINGRFRMSPLILAASYGHFDCVETLVEGGAKINAKDRMKRNALMMAVRNGNVKIASYLLAHGIDFNKPDSSDNYPIHYAAAYGFPECIDLLIRTKADVNVLNSWKLTPLAVAMLKNNYHCVRRLLEVPGIDVNCKDDQGRTLINQIIMEITRVSFEQLKYLISEKRADLTIVDLHGMSPLHNACNLQPEQIAERSNGVSRMSRNKRKQAIKDAQNLKYEIIEFLLQQGADINLKREKLAPPIFYAFKSKDPKIINMFIDHPSMNLLYETESNGTIYNLLSRRLLDEFGFDVCEKIIDRTGNQNNILNRTIIISRNGEQREENVLSIFLRAFLDITTKAYWNKYNEEVKAYNREQERQRREEQRRVNDSSDHYDDESEDDYDFNQYGYGFGRPRGLFSYNQGMNYNVLGNIGSLYSRRSYNGGGSSRPKDGVSDEMIPEEVKEEIIEKAQVHQTNFIRRAIHILDRLKSEGAEMLGKPYPLYQTYDDSCYPYIVWILENFKDKCDLNAKEGLALGDDNRKNKGEAGNQDNDGTDIGSDLESDGDLNQAEDYNDYSSDDDYDSIKGQMYQRRVNHDNLPYDDDYSDDDIPYSRRVDRRYSRHSTRRRNDCDNKTILHYLIESTMRFSSDEPWDRSKYLRKHLVQKYSVDETFAQEASGFRLLLEFFNLNRIDFQVTTRQGANPATLFCYEYDGDNALSFFKDLCHYNVDPDATDLQGGTPILIAAEKGWSDIVKYLLKLKVDINVCDNSGKTILHTFVKNKETSGLKKLLEIGTDPNIADLDGKTPLHLAVSQTSPEDMFEAEGILIRSGADVNAVDKMGRTPLHYSFLSYDGRLQDKSGRDSVECVASLCDDPNIDINVRDRRGRTPLHYAAAMGAYGSVMFLLSRNVELDVKDADKNTPLALALSRGYEELASILIMKGASVYERLHHIDELRLVGEDSNSDDIRLSRRMNSDLAMNIEQEDDDYDDAKNEDRSTGKKRKKQNSLFALAIRNNWQGVAYLLLQNGYDTMSAVKDALREQKYRYVLALIHKATDNKVFNKTDEKKKNLLHIFAKHGLRAGQEYGVKIYEQLIRGVDYTARDHKGRTPLHYAAKAGYTFLEEHLLKKEDIEVDAQDYQGYTALVASTVSNQSSINKVHMYMKYKADPTVRFTAKVDNHEVETGLVTYLASQNCEDRHLIKILLRNGASINEADSDGYTPLIHAVRNNSMRMARFYSASSRLDVNAVDNKGKTPIHHVVNPLEFGSYENARMLRMLAECFDINKPDDAGKPPIYYAHLQDSGVMLRALRKLDANDIYVDDEILSHRSISVVSKVQWGQDTNFDEDADNYIQEAKTQEMDSQEDERVKSDDNADNARSLEVVYDDKLGPYSLYMTKVNVKKGGYGEYMFYRMQILHNPTRDVFVLFTRWGRIGETGAYQNTPFGQKDDAIAEFNKIFEQKSKNKWADKDNFRRVEGKYRLLNIEANTRSKRRDYLRPIHFDDKHLLESEIAPEVQTLMKIFANVDLYRGALQSLNIDNSVMPFGQISRRLLEEAKDTLHKIQSLISELQEAKYDRDYDTANVLALTEKIADKSSRFFELIPDVSFRNQPVQPIDSERVVLEKLKVVDSLFDLEVSSKILLGALYNIRDINPMDYCFNSLRVKMVPLSSNTREYNLILPYLRNGYSSYEEGFVQNIFAVERKDEANSLSRSRRSNNRMYLWHGTKASNMMGILSQGLRIAPVEAQLSGASLGSGIYFSDMFEKSLSYTDSQGVHGGKSTSSFVLLCEVDLGKPYEVSGYGDLRGMDGSYDSIISRGSREPVMRQEIVLMNGAKIPSGALVNDGARSYDDGSEFVVFDVSQVKIRYLIQVKKNSASRYANRASYMYGGYAGSRNYGQIADRRRYNGYMRNY